MIDDRSIRQLHENATGSSKEGREVYQLTKKTPIGVSNLNINKDLLDRTTDFLNQKKESDNSPTFFM